MSMNNNQSINQLNLAANIAQFVDLWLILKDSTNEDVLRALQNQNNIYLEEILKKLNTIEERLNRLEKK